MHKNSKLCLNCGNKIKDNYCSHCGQSTKTGRIEYKAITNDLEHIFVYLHREVLYAVKELLIHPRHMILAYISGQRKKYISPIQYLFVLGAFYSVVLHLANVFPDIEVNKFIINEIDYSYMYTYYYEYYSLWLLFSTPIFAFSSYLFYRKNGFNYMEHLVIYSYITGTKIFILLVFYPIFYFTYSVAVYDIMAISTIVYNLIILMFIFKSSSWWWALIKSVLSIAFVLLIFCLLLLIYLILKCNI